MQHQGDWFHIDDADFLRPLGSGDRKLYGRCGLVPYSLSAPIGTLSLASLHGYSHTITSSLGELYSVPSDSRLPLEFEKHQLRKLCDIQGIDGYLRNAKHLFSKFEHVGGTFHVIDFDDFMSHAAYSPHPGPGEADYLRQDPSIDFFSGPALRAEEFRLNIPPSRQTLALGHAQNSVNITDGPKNWHRLIFCRGLAHTVLSDRQGQDQDMVQRECTRIRSLLFQNDDDVVEEALLLHLHCRRREDTSNPYRPRKPKKPAFHITWYRIPRPGEQPPSLACWKWGEFYKTGRLLQQAAFTFALVPSKSWDRYDTTEDTWYNHAYWTVFTLVPLHFGNLAGYRLSSSGVLAMIGHALRDAADSWEEIAVIMAQVLRLGNGDDALDPDKHDSLLFDDHTFSRSRRYFWAVDMLETFMAEIKGALAQWEYWWDVWEQPVRNFDAAMVRRVEQRNAEDTEGFPMRRPWRASVDTALEDFVDPQIHRLRQLHGQFKGLLESTHNLRDAVRNY